MVAKSPFLSFTTWLPSFSSALWLTPDRLPAVFFFCVAPESSTQLSCVISHALKIRYVLEALLPESGKSSCTQWRWCDSWVCPTVSYLVLLALASLPWDVEILPV